MLHVLQVIRHILGWDEQTTVGVCYFGVQKINHVVWSIVADTIVSGLVVQQEWQSLKKGVVRSCTMTFVGWSGEALTSGMVGTP